MTSDVITADGDLVIRRMRDDDDDYDLIVRWRNLPHVRHWWDPDLPPLTLELAKEEHRADTAPDAVSTACIIELNGSPIGFIQYYRWSSYGDDAREVGIPFDQSTFGLDIFIGDEDLVGQGIGTRVVRLLSDHLLHEMKASSVALTTDLKNAVAIRCYEKAGFRKIKEVLDTDTRHGQRTRSWLMVKNQPEAGRPRASTAP